MMRIFYIALFMMVSVLPMVAQDKSVQTYCYRQTGVIENGIRKSGDNSILYVTRNNDVVYDSDKNGFTVNNGRLTKSSEDSKFTSYHGYSYWGQCIYRFKNDYQKLNIIVETGDKRIFIYDVTSSQAGTCTHIKGKAIQPTSSSKTNRQTSHITEKTKKLCSVCNGTGKVKYYITPISNSNLYERCNECGENRMGSNHHTHRQCEICHGNGYIYDNTIIFK